jgi:hypothetical protein
VRQPAQVGLDQAGAAVADQQRLEDAVAAHGGEVVGVQQRGTRVLHRSVERHEHARVASHGAKD